MKLSVSALASSLCKQSFKDFVKEFWEEINSESLVWGWHMEVICDSLQESAERVFNDLPCEKDTIINISPGTSKSTICSQMYPAWIWTNFPQAQIVLASYTGLISNQNSSKCRDIVTSDKYRRYFNVQLRKDSNGKSFFSNNKGGFVYSVGTGGALTGKHAHFILIDDPLNPKEAASQKELATANQWLSETVPSRKVKKETAFTALIMQRLSENDCTGYLLEKKRDKINHICIPAEVSDIVSPPELKAKYIDGLMDNIRLNRNVINTMQRDLGAYAYACQFEQHPVPRSGGLFRTDNFVFTDNLPEPVVKMIRYWDKAGTRDSGCYTAGVKVARLQSGAYIVLDVVKGQWEPFERNRIMKQTAELDGKGCGIAVEMEPGSGGKESALLTVSDLAGYNVEIDKPASDKYTRATPFSCQVNVGNVYLLKGDWNADFISELRLFPNSKYKDQVDAVSAGFNLICKTKTIDYRKWINKDTAKESTENKAVKKINGIILP